MWGVGDKLAVRSSQVCAPGGLKACPLGNFEILDAFSCNLVHILSQNYLFTYILSMKGGGGACAPHAPPGSAPVVSRPTCRKWHHRNAQVQHLSCCLVVVLLWCENTIRPLQGRQYMPLRRVKLVLKHQENLWDL